MPNNPPLPRPEDRPRVEERLHKMVRRWPEVSGYRLQPDPDVVEGIVQALVRSTMMHGLGYCPCRDLTGDPEVDRANVCPCAHHHQEIKTQGYCKCQLFVGEGYDPAVAYRPEPATIQQKPLRSVRHRWVTVYSTRWCFHSRRTKALLDKLSIPYEDVDIEQDPEAARRVEGWNGGYRSVPTVVARLVITEPTTSELATVIQTPSALLDGLCVNVTRWCATSRRTLAWLRDNAVPHVSVDIEQDANAARQVTEWNQGYQSVPTLDVTLRITEPTSDELVQMLGLGAPH